MSNQKKAILVGILVATNVGGFLLYMNRSAAEGEEVAAQEPNDDTQATAQAAAEPPAALPAAPPAAAAAPSEGTGSELAQAAETARLAGIRATEAGRHDEAVARFREAIELGSTDESVVALLVAAQRARAVTQTARPRARREQDREVRPQGRLPRPQGRQRAARREPEPEFAAPAPAAEPAPEPVAATPPEPEPEPVTSPTPQVELPSNEMERNPYVRGGR